MSTGLLFVLLPGVAVWLAVLTLRPRWLVALAAVLVLVQFNWFNRYYEVPAYFNRLSLAMIGVLAVVLFIRRAGGRGVRLSGAMLNPVMHLAVFFVCLTLVSNAYNREDMVLGFFELRYYFVGFVLTYALYAYYGPALDSRTFKRVIVCIALAQIPFTVLQFVTARGGAARTLDSVTGTFSVYTELVACQVLAIGLVLTHKLIRKSDLMGANSYVVILALLAPLILSKSKLATGFVVLVVAFAWLYASVKTRSAGLLVRHFYTIGILLAVIVSLFYSLFWERMEFKKYLQPDAVYAYFTTEPVVDYGQVAWIKARRLGRLSAITESVDQTFSDPVHAAVGFGAGSVSVSAALDRQGRMYDEPGYGELAGINRNEYSKTIMEFGLAGIAGLLWFFFSLHRRMRRARMGPEATSGFATMVFCLIPMSFYGLTLGTFFTSFVVALFVASVQSELDKREMCLSVLRRHVAAGGTVVRRKARDGGGRSRGRRRIAPRLPVPAGAAWVARA